MTPIEDQTLGQRIVTTLIIALMILFLLAFIGWISGGWEAEGQYITAAAIPGEPSRWDDQMFALDREALQDAYRDQLKHLFLVALKSADKHSFSRAEVGARNARIAYIAVMDAIDKREKDITDKRKP